MAEEDVLGFHKNIKNLIFIYMFGFFIGNIYANLFVEEYISSIGIFNEYFLNHYVLTDINEKRYLIYLFRLRLFPAIVLWGLGFTRFRNIIMFVFLVWTGFLCGIVVAAAIIKMGIIGSVFVLLIVLPHMLFYFGAYMILLCNMCSYPKVKWNYLQIIVKFLFICIGIVTECYINPALIKMFLKTV